jgi:Fe2+ or Zn2+ uptake regulation protein
MKIEMLFGGMTRFSTIEALAEARQPITAYQIAMTKGLDPAATYRCLTELSDFRIVEFVAGKRNQTFYKLSDGSGQAAVAFLRSLKQKTSTTVDLEEWMSPEMQAERMKKIVKLDQLDDPIFRNTNEEQSVDELMSKRVPGELSALIISSKLAFDELFEQKNNMFILKA